MKLNEAKNKLLNDPVMKRVFEQKDIDDLKINVGLQILELRLLKNVTQAKLAKLIGTEQPSIARAERGAIVPSLTFLHKIATALDTYLISPKFAIVEENEARYQQSITATEFRSTLVSTLVNGAVGYPESAGTSYHRGYMTSQVPA